MHVKSKVTFGGKRRAKRKGLGKGENDLIPPRGITWLTFIDQQMTLQMDTQRAAWIFINYVI